VNAWTRMILVLALFSLTSGAALAFSYEATYPMIQEQAQKALEQSVVNVIPGATEMSAIDKDGMTFYQGTDNDGNVKGIAFKATGSGFGGPIEIMVGYDPEQGVLTGIEIISMSETPGLGAKIKEANFTDQFRGKSVEDNFVPKEDVDVITGATISPTAVANAIKSALAEAVNEYPVGGDL
jgi:electron transport complex protein RnfG